MRSTSPHSAIASPAGAGVSAAAYRSVASVNSSTASANAPRTRMIWPRCTAHWPVKGTSPGWASIQAVRALVHSAARPKSETSWQASINEQ